MNTIFPGGFIKSSCLSVLFILFANSAFAAGAAWERSVVDVPFPQRMIERFDTVDAISGKKARAIAVCGGVAYTATDKGIAVYNGKIWSPAGGVNEKGGVSAIMCGSDKGEVVFSGSSAVFSLKSGKAEKIADAPGVAALANYKKAVLAGGASGLYLIQNKKAVKIAGFDKRVITIIEVDSDGAAWVGTETGLAKYDGKKVQFFNKAADGTNGLMSDNIRALYIDEKGTLLIGTPVGISKFDRKSSWDYITGKHGGLPYEDVTSLSGAKGYLWAGTSMGAARYDGKEWHYYQGPEHLPSDSVTAVAALPEGGAIIGTAAGVSKAWFKMTALEEKAKFFEDLTRRNHNRYGLFSDSSLKVPGDYSTNVMFTNDNDGLWTAMYVAAECYRYGATGDPEAKRFARESLDAMMMLEKVTEIPGFMARSFAKPDDPHCNGEWDHITSDGKWRWKGDTSSDEVVGHYYAYSVYNDICADDGEKEEIKKVVDRITSYIVDNGYYLLDTDGKPTTFGHWSPSHFKAEGRFQRGLNSLELLSHLITAYHITGNEKFEQHYKHLINDERYAKFTIDQKLNQPNIINHSDDELAFLSYYPLLKYEYRSFALDSFRKSMARSWKIERPERNPLWNFIYAAGGMNGDFDLGQAVWTLQRIPLTMLRWGHTNSKRADIEIDKSKGRFSEPQSVSPVPPDEREITLWNANPFSLDSGGNGSHEQPGTFYLLPYWMARYYGYIVDQQ